MDLMTISALALRAGVTTATIRHYDRCGLLPPTGRGAGGSRLYDDLALDRLRMIRRIRTTGLSLDETRSLLEILSDAGAGRSPGTSPELLERRLAMIREHLDFVRGVEQTLSIALSAMQEVAGRAVTRQLENPNEDLVR